MNLIEAQRNLQGIPDDALVKEMRQPSGLAPQYLVLSELQRRKQMRAGAAQAPKSTVRQDIVGFAEGGQVENKPGWMSGGLGDFLNSGLLGFGLPLLNDVADSDTGLFGIGLQPWILKQLGFGNKGEQPPTNLQPQSPAPMRGFAGGGDVKKSDYHDKLIKRESDPKAASPFLSSNKDTHAIGAYQIMPDTWNDAIARFKIKGVKPVSRTVRPGDPDFPTEAEQRLVYPHIESDFDNALQRSGYELSEPNKYIVHWQGPGAGTKLLDYYAANPDATAEEAFKYARPDAYKKVMRQNNINPKAMIADVMGKVEKDFGGYSIGTRLNEDGIIIPSREEFAADLQRTAGAAEDPDYLALLQEQRMSSVPRESAWSGQAQPQQMMAPGQAMMGPPINGGGIDQLMPQLTSPTRRPGEGPAPWQVIAGPQSYGGRFQAAKGYAEGGAVKVKNGIQYRENEAGNFVDAQGRPYPEDWNAMTSGLETMGRGVDAAGDIVGGVLGGIGDAAKWATQPTGQRAPMFGRPQPPAPPPTPSVPMPKVDQAGMLQGFRQMMSTPESIAAENETKANASAAGGSDFDTMEQYLSNRKQLNEPSYDVGIPSDPRDAERDKWLALTEFGSRLAAGSSPYFAQNFGPAAAAGIASYRQSQSQYDEDMMKRTNARIQQAQLNELARSRTDNTAAKLVEVQGGVEQARLRAQAQLLRMSAALKYGQSIDPQTYASRLRDYKDLIMNDPVLTYEQKLIEMKKAEAMVFNDLQSKGIYKSQRGLGAAQDDGKPFDGDVAD